MHPETAEAAEFIKKTISTEPLVGRLLAPGLRLVTDHIDLTDTNPLIGRSPYHWQGY